MKKLLALLLLLPSLAAAQTPTTPGVSALVCAFNTVIPSPTAGQFFYVQCDANGKLITSAAGAAVTITANSTATSGFSAGQYLYSDGSKVQAGTFGSGVATALANTAGASGGFALFNNSLSALTPLASVAKSTDFTTIAGNLGSSIDVTTGSSADVTITLLSAVTAGSGGLQWVAKVDSGTKKVIVTNGVTQQAWLSNINDTIIMRSNGTSWAPYWYSIAPRIDNYTAGSSTWTKPPLATVHWVGLIGGGGGGGSGAQIGLVSASGGAGGQSGSYTWMYFASSELSATEPVIVGAGGAGGAAQASTSAAGNNGGVPSVSSFGTAPYIVNAGVSAAGTGIAPLTGAVGGQIAGAAAVGPNTTGRSTGPAAGAGVSGASGGGGGNSGTIGSPMGGTAGAGQTGAAAANFNGGSGGQILWMNVLSFAVGGIGSTKTAPITGTSNQLDYGIVAGGGGGGGWANADGTASAGSNGSICGGGGGGGGTSTNGSNSGAGGNGADGCVKVITWFQ